MPGAADRRREALTWLAKADEDLLVATHSLGLGARCPTAVVCYHAQQCVEKSIKAFLVDQGTPFPYVHDIGLLHGLVALSDRFSLSSHDERELTLSATAMRYPGGGTPSLAEAEAAVETARRVRADLAQRLVPPPATGQTT
ncbi:MAG: HEPN domain-containing protein [Armatimonadetes bacterium]|nr:HEPN domain-containing protein [Armatimonadota bacterium]